MAQSARFYTLRDPTSPLCKGYGSAGLSYFSKTELAVEVHQAKSETEVNLPLLEGFYSVNVSSKLS